MTRDLDDFVADARTFVAAQFPRCGDDASSGTGPVAVIPERPAEVEERELAEARAWRRTSFDAGYGWVDGPAAYGGAGLGAEFADAWRAVEREFAVPDEGYTRFSVGILTPTLLEHGTPVLLDELLVPLRRADVVSAQLFSEPDAGSDLASVRTRAVREGDEWVVHGQKVWTSGAHYSGVGLLLARTDPETKRAAGTTVFMIDMDQPGVEVRPIRQLTGGASFSEVFLDGARVPDARRVGAVGSGWAVINSCLMHERAVIGSDGAIDLALVDRLVGVARRTGAWDDPVVRDRLADVHVRAHANNLMTLGFLDDAGVGGMPGAEMAMSKLALTDNLARLAAVADDVLGEALAVETGLTDGFTWSQLPLTLEGLRIGGGTDEILRSIVAQRVLGLPRG